MLDRLFNFADSRATLVAFVIFVVATFVLISIDPRKGKIPQELGPDVVHIPVGATFSPNVEGFRKMLRVYEARQDYAEVEKQMLIYDSFYLVIYGIAGAFILAYFLQHAFHGSFRFLALLPVFAAFFDAVENATMYVCLGRNPDAWLWLLYVSRAATMVKWILLAADLVLLLLCIGKIALASLTARPKSARA